jgi:hypothetical protein
MYAPGFFSGAFIKNHGPTKPAAVAIVMFLGATLVNVLAAHEEHFCLPRDMCTLVGAEGYRGGKR